METYLEGGQYAAGKGPTIDVRWNGAEDAHGAVRHSGEGRNTEKLGVALIIVSAGPYPFVLRYRSTKEAVGPSIPQGERKLGVQWPKR